MITMFVRLLMMDIIFLTMVMYGLEKYQMMERCADFDIYKPTKKWCSIPSENYYQLRQV
jgi:hypothetical protein